MDNDALCSSVVYELTKVVDLDLLADYKILVPPYSGGGAAAAAAAAGGRLLCPRPFLTARPANAIDDWAGNARLYILP
jgi:hypothetical protein